MEYSETEPVMEKPRSTSVIISLDGGSDGLKAAW
jgi:hypothetical protein